MKKIDLKLLGIFVSLAISMVLLICSKWAKVCILLACIFMATSIVLLAIFRQSQWQKTIIETDKDLEENEDEVDAEEYAEVEKLKKKLGRKQARLQFVLYISALLIIVAGILSIIW